MVLLAAVAAALVCRSTLQRKGSLSHWSIDLLTPFLVIAFAGVLAVAWTAWAWTPASKPLPFSEETWGSRPWVRERMAQDIVDRDLLKGMTEGQAEVLLGAADGSGGDSAWVLWRQRDAFSPFPPELVIYLDEHGRISRYYIAPGIWEAVLTRQ